MPLKNRHRPDGKKRHRMIAPQKTSGVVDAVIFQQISITLCLNIQNLFDFFIDCLNKLATSSAMQPIFADHVSQCISHIEEVYSENSAVFNNELRNLIIEFLDDGHSLTKLIASITASSSDKKNHKNYMAQLTAKVAHLQWLSACILQEIKIAYSYVFLEKQLNHPHPKNQ